MANKNVLKATMASAVLASAVIPVAVAPVAAEAAAPVTEVVYVIDGKEVSISFDVFTEALNAEILSNLDIKFIKAADGNYYEFPAFTEALNASESLEEALELLAADPELVQPITPVEGTVNPDGSVTAPDEETGELKVESVSAIDETGVTVSFDALTEAKEGATITVVDPSGKTVEVTPVNLEIGDTSATFDFVTAYEELPLGTFVVQGKDFDTAAVDAVAKVNEATNVVELWNALQSKYFTGALEANIEKYDTLLDGTQTTVAEVQAIIDEVNQADMDAEAEAATVKKVADATNVLQLLNALKDPAFSNVNADWITDYSTENVTLDDDSTTVGLLALDSTYYFGETPGATIEGIQDAIDAQNLTKAGNAVTAAEGTLSQSDITDARALVNKYVPADTEGVTTKKALLDRLAEHEAVVNVTAANTNAKLSSAFNALDKVSDDFDIATVNPKELTRYRDDIKAAKDVAITGVNDATKLQGLVTTANTNAETAAVSAVAGVSATATDAEVKALLNTLADRSAFGTDGFKGAVINDALLEKYRDAIVAETTPANKDEASEIKGIIDTANSPRAALTTLVDGTNALTDSDKLLTALKDPTLNLSVVDANKDAYFAAGDFAKIKQKAAIDKDAVQAIVKAIDARVELNNATNGSAAKTALDKYAVSANNAPYLNQSTVGKLEVANIVFDAMPSTGYADTGAVYTAINNALSTRTNLIGAINSATNIVTTNAALDALDYKAFEDLSATDKVTVAEKFFNAIPVNEAGAKVAYKSFADIYADIDKAITAAGL